MENVEERILELRKLIGHYNRQYHQFNISEITDYEFDEMYRELVSLEARYPELVTADSPTQTVGHYERDIMFGTAKHPFPMVSLGNVFTHEELMEWIRGLPEGVSGIGEYKLDGLSLELIYEDGQLVQAITRGDGFEGDSVIANALMVKGVIKYIDHVKGRQIIRGEVVVPKAVFARKNEELRLAGEKVFANERNYAAGSLRQKNWHVTGERELSFIAYSYTSDDVPFLNHMDAMQYLFSKDFNIAPCFCIFSTATSADEMLMHLSMQEVQRPKLPWLIDGLVFKVNDYEIQKQLGSRSREPRWATAYKFQAEVAETPLIGIDFQIGRTGALTPVGRLQPVPLAGVVVSNATLHNVAELRRLGVAIGDTVSICRAGDVVPKILDVVKKGNDRTYIDVPTECPSCNGTLYLINNTTLQCVSEWACPAQRQRRFEHLVSRKAFDIDGLADKTLETLYSELGLITWPADIYKLKSSDIANLEGFGEVSANNLISAIERSRRQPLARFIYALGINEVGESTAKDLAKYFKTFQAFQNATTQQLLEINGVGPATAAAISHYFVSPDNLGVVEELLKYVTVEDHESLNVEQDLAGQTFVITGSFPGISRDQIREALELRGAKVSSAVSKKTTCVIVGADAGSKAEDAKRLKIKIIGAEELDTLLGSK